MTIPKYFKAKIALDKKGKKIGYITGVNVSFPETIVMITVSKKSLSKNFPPLCFYPQNMIKFTEKKIWFDITKKEVDAYFNEIYAKHEQNKSK